MDSDSNDDYQNSDLELDDEAHNKLVENVLNISRKQHVKKPSRTEPTINISEYDLVKTGRNIKLNDLTKSLKQTAKHVKLGKKVLGASKNAKTLPKPLEKPQEERIRRTVAYDSAKKTLNKWEPIVESNRAAEILKFPLESASLRKKPDLINFRMKTKLMEELEKLEPPKVEVFNIELEEEKFPLTMEEILDKRKEAAKMRAQQSYREAKARRQSKIKSKKYHRIMKREKIKQQMKDFETLQKTDPEAALAKLDEIEKARAEERMSLRHKSTGQWAKSKQFRAKYDSESRKVLAQQLAISRDLTQKLKPKDDNESETEETIPTEISKVDNSNNPWVNGANMKISKEVDDFVSGYRKYWDDRNSMTEANKIATEEAMDNIKSEIVKDTKSKTNGDLIEGNDNNKITVEAFKSPPKKANKRKLIETTENNQVDSNVVQENDLEIKAMPKKVKSKKIKCTTEWEVTETNVEKAFNKMDYNLRQKLQERYNKVSKDMNLKPSEKKERLKKIKSKVKKIDFKLNKKTTKPIIYDALNETTGKEGDVINNVNNDVKKLKVLLAKPKSDVSDDIDPNKFVKVKTTNLKSDIPDLLSFAEEEEVSDNDQRATITEAFEDDDIVEEFQKEKKADIEANNPKAVDSSLPGWGSWGGKDIAVSTRKKRRFITRFPKQMPRKDKNKGSLIINEKANNKARPLMVSEVPFPFKTVKDFEASIRAPVGQTFVPENAFRKLTKPSLVTKIGTIIEPMDDDVLLKKKK